MKKQIQRVSPMQNAKMMAALYLVMSLPVLGMLWGFAAATGQAGVTGVMLVAFPLGYALGGFIFTLIAAWLYNLVASVVGGFEFTTKEITG